jgi:hypothetical protein
MSASTTPPVWPVLFMPQSAPSDGSLGNAAAVMIRSGSYPRTPAAVAHAAKAAGETPGARTA